MRVAAAATHPTVPRITHTHTLPCLVRWRLHLDVERSVDAMLAASPAGDANSIGSTPASSSSSKQLQVDTQLRMRGPCGRVMVQFESPGAAQAALAGAAAIAAAAAGDGDERGDGADSGGAEEQGAWGRNARGGSSSSGRSAVGVRGFSGGWLVDLVHAAVHRAIAGPAEVVAADL